MARSTRSFLSEVARKRSRGLRVGSNSVNRFLKAQLEAEARQSAIFGVQSEQLRQQAARDVESTRRFNVRSDFLSRQEEREAGAARLRGIADIGKGIFSTQSLAKEAGVPQFGPISLARTAGEKLGFIDPKVVASSPSLSSTGSTVGGSSTERAGGVTQRLAGTVVSPSVATAGGALAEEAASRAGAEAGALVTQGVTEGTPTAVDTFLSGAGTALTTAGAGIGANFLAQEFGANQELSNFVGGAASGAVVGASSAALGTQFGAFAGPVGAVIGGVIGLVAGEIFEDTVICTELNRQGILSDSLYKVDKEFVSQNIDVATYVGYRLWAGYIVKAMQSSKLISKMVGWFIVPWAKQAGSIVDSNIKGTLLGRTMMKVGIPVCRYMGERKIKQYMKEDLSWQAS